MQLARKWSLVLRTVALCLCASASVQGQAANEHCFRIKLDSLRAGDVRLQSHEPWPAQVVLTDSLLPNQQTPVLHLAWFSPVTSPPQRGIWAMAGDSMWVALPTRPMLGLRLTFRADGPDADTLSGIVTDFSDYSPRPALRGIVTLIRLSPVERQATSCRAPAG